MASYILSNQAKADLIRIYHYGAFKFGEIQADKYFYNFFDYFELIAQSPQTFEAVDYIKPGYRRCVCGIDSIFFHVNGGIVEIMAIVGRQDINKMFK